LAGSDNKDLADHPRVDKDAGKALAPVVLVAPVSVLEAPVVLVGLVGLVGLAVLADQVDQAQNVLVGLISRGQ